MSARGLPMTQVALERPDQPDVIALIGALDDYQRSLYPPESCHLLDLATLMQPQVLFAVARDGNGSAVGCAAIVRDSAAGELKRFYVQPGQRGQGVASGLLALLEQKAQAAGCSGWLRLETGPCQAEALAFYRRQGYTDCARFGSYADDPLSVFMHKRLAASA